MEKGLLGLEAVEGFVEELGRVVDAGWEEEAQRNWERLVRNVEEGSDIGRRFVVLYRSAVFCY